MTEAQSMGAPCAHQSPDLCVSWDYPMVTVDGTEWFAHDNLDEERWLLPRKEAPRG